MGLRGGGRPGWCLRCWRLCGGGSRAAADWAVRAAGAATPQAVRRARPKPNKERWRSARRVSGMQLWPTRTYTLGATPPNGRSLRRESYTAKRLKTRSCFARRRRPVSKQWQRGWRSRCQCQLYTAHSTNVALRVAHRPLAASPVTLMTTATMQADTQVPGSARLLVLFDGT